MNRNTEQQRGAVRQSRTTKRGKINIKHQRMSRGEQQKERLRQINNKTAATLIAKGDIQRNSDYEGWRSRAKKLNTQSIQMVDYSTCSSN